jgi:hypothetical protein
MGKWSLTGTDRFPATEIRTSEAETVSLVGFGEGCIASFSGCSRIIYSLAQGNLCAAIPDFDSFLDVK